MDLILEIYEMAASINNALPKAMVNYLVREPLEDTHSKHNISQEDMEKIIKEAVNRAYLLVMIMSDPKLLKAFQIEAMTCAEWDEPEMTPDIVEDLELFKRIAKELD